MLRQQILEFIQRRPGRLNGIQGAAPAGDQRPATESKPVGPGIAWPREVLMCLNDPHRE